MNAGVSMIVEMMKAVKMKEETNRNFHLVSVASNVFLGERITDDKIPESPITSPFAKSKIPAANPINKCIVKS